MIKIFLQLLLAIPILLFLDVPQAILWILHVVFLKISNYLGYLYDALGRLTIFVCYPCFVLIDKITESEDNAKNNYR